MQQYNTQMPKVKLPEYGRNLQELVEYCKTIPDRDKRTRYAYGIVSIMGDLYPEAEKVENLRQILWDHLALISNYEHVRQGHRRYGGQGLRDRGPGSAHSPLRALRQPYEAPFPRHPPHSR